MPDSKIPTPTPSVLCYICSPYRGANELEVEQNIFEARKLAVKVIEETGWFPVSPVLNTAGFHKYEGTILPGISSEFWLAGDIVLLNVCHAIAVSDDMRWSKSEGCLKELKEALTRARAGRMTIRVGSTVVEDIEVFSKMIDEKLKGGGFHKRTAPSFEMPPLTVGPFPPLVPADQVTFQKMESSNWKMPDPLVLAGPPIPQPSRYYRPDPRIMMDPLIIRDEEDIPATKPGFYETSVEQKAFELAVKAHAGQVDKSGQPYIFHPMAVAAEFKTSLERMVAILHDVVEDTKVTQAEIDAKFPSQVAGAVKAITHLKGETNVDYLARCAKNPTAKAVKIADVKHNLGRMNFLMDAEVKSRLEKKYQKALDFLMGEKEA